MPPSLTLRLSEAAGDDVGQRVTATLSNSGSFIITSASALAISYSAHAANFDSRCERAHEVCSADDRDQPAARMTGTRLIRFVSSNTAMSATAVVSVTEITSAS